MYIYYIGPKLQAVITERNSPNFIITKMGINYNLMIISYGYFTDIDI